MEYGCKFPELTDLDSSDNCFNESCNTNYQKVGYNPNDSCISALFSKQNLKLVSNKISELLQGVDVKGRKIVVTDDVICSVMSNIQQNRIPQVGDIYSRYIIGDGNPRNDFNDIVSETIATIVTYTKGEFGMAENNNKLNIWDATILGSFNKLGLRSHPPIKIRNRRTAPMQFNMNY